MGRQQKSGHAGSHREGVGCGFCLKGKETIFRLGQDYTFCHMRLKEHQQTKRTVGVNLLKDGGREVIGRGGGVGYYYFAIIVACTRSSQAKFYY